MTKYEFLEKMRHALANDLNGSVIQDNINYYDGYISDEVRKGRSEAAVIEELGDPWAIARTIIESVENTSGGQEGYTYDPAQQGYGNGQQKQNSSIRVIGVDSWWKKLLVILGVLGIVMLVVAVIGGIFSLLAPIIVPILIIMLIVRLIGGRRR